MTPQHNHADAALLEFADCAARKIEQDFRQIARCVGLLTIEEAWSRPNERCNSVANLVLHLTGNMRQWIIGGLGDDPTPRDRPAEFAARDPAPAAPILAAFEHVVQRSTAILRSMTTERLARRYTIQGYDVTGVLAAFHVAEHVSFHCGQIVHITKIIRNVDLSLYDAQGRTATQSGGQPWIGFEKSD